MTSFLPPLSTATAPHNEIICPELRISEAYLPRTQNLRGWPAQKIPAAELIPHQNRSCFLRQNPPNFVWATVPNPLPIFHTLFDLYSTHCRGLSKRMIQGSSRHSENTLPFLECLSVWFLLTTRARRWAPPRAAVTRWWPSTDPASSPSLQGATTARYPPGVRPEGRGRRE